MAHPARFDEADPLLHRLREMCLAMPGSREKVSHGRPSFFTTKIFAIFGGVVKGDHQSAVLGRALVFLPDEGERAALLEDARFVVPGYEGAYGWLALRLDDPLVDWSEVAELVQDSYRRTAPAALVRELGAAIGDNGGSRHTDERHEPTQTGH
ncbi:MAG: MmcQ/YjbR family DNA-binding protein [Candidatus Phosphoribacter sp.]